MRLQHQALEYCNPVVENKELNNFAIKFLKWKIFNQHFFKSMQIFGDYFFQFYLIFFLL